MRQLQNAGLAAAVALVFATVAQAAVTTASSSRVTTTNSTMSASTMSASSGTVSGSPSLNRQGTLISNAPRIDGPNTSSSGATSSGSSTVTNTNTSVQGTDVDLRDQQTRRATAGTHASGSTSALGPLANGGALVNGTTTGTTSGAGATGTTTLPPFSGTPIFSNPSDATFGAASVNSPTTMAAAATTNGFASTDVVFGNASIAAQGIAVTEAQANSANVDRAINQVSRDRKRVGRNGQLLYSIAPRSNVDRTHQMPDDPLPPTLTGSNSTLVR